MGLFKRLFHRKVAANDKNGTGSSRVVELGTQLAQAIAAQRRHEETHGAPNSPLAELRYSSIENRLWRWVESAVDSRIEPIVTDFAALGEEERNSVRDSLSMDDFYTLLAFARRRALAVLRGSEARQIEVAFVSIAMIDIERVDWRDLLMANSLVCYAGERIGAPVADFVSRTIQLSVQKTAKALMRQPNTRIDLARSCGYREVRTSEGVALFDTGYEHFAPKADLIKLAFEIAEALDTDGYEISSVEVACRLPLIWLSADEGSPISKVVQVFSGCVSISGVPRADPAPKASGQSLLVFVAEAASEEHARAVAASAEASSNSLHTELGLAWGKLCAVIIQWSWLVDTPPFEDIRSLERLRPMLQKLLAS